MTVRLVRVPNWLGWLVFALLAVALAGGRSRGADPPEPPAEMPHAVYVERLASGDVLEWTQAGPKGEVTWVWTVAAGGRATEELAAALVKQKLCVTGRCPLLPVKVRLIPKKKFD